MTHHLLGLYDSPYVRRVAITLTHYGIPFTHESLSVFRHAEEMRRSNPLLRVPMLVTPDGERLHESAFILDYLDELARAGEQVALIPAGGPLRRAVWQLTALAQAVADKAVAIAYERRRPPDLRWPDWEQRLREQIGAALGQLEEALTGDYFVGEHLSHADVMSAVALGFIVFTIPDIWTAGRFPKVEALARRLEQTAEFKAVPIDEV